MNQRLGLDISMQQQLKINAQLLQTMETLTLSSQELREKVEKEAETICSKWAKENQAIYAYVMKKLM